MVTVRRPRVKVNTLSRQGQQMSEVFVWTLRWTVRAVWTVEKECGYTCLDI